MTFFNCQPSLLRAMLTILKKPMMLCSLYLNSNIGMHELLSQLINDKVLFNVVFLSPSVHLSEGSSNQIATYLHESLGDDGSQSALRGFLNAEILSFVRTKLTFVLGSRKMKIVHTQRMQPGWMTYFKCNDVTILCCS